MSQETQIGNLGGGISDEDSKLVDSILNDLNGGPQQQQQRMRMIASATNGCIFMHTLRTFSLCPTMMLAKNSVNTVMTV